MSTQRKQYADLVRHREFNALRRLMVGRLTPSPTIRPTLPTKQLSAHSASHALSNIDELEVQMNQDLFDRSLRDIESEKTGFLTTDIVSFKSILADTHTPPILGQTHDQVTLTQAAGLFAVNRMSEVQALLTHALSAQGTLHDHVPTWLALFDFYRATNQAHWFDSMALDYSVRFGRSTPSWISFPELAERAHHPFKEWPQRESNTGANAQITTCDWTAPAYLTDGAMAGFDELIQKAMTQKRSFHLDWRDLVSVDPAQWPTIKNQLSAIASHPLHCVMYGQASFQPAFTKDLPEAMLAHLALLRCQNQAAAFEELAMDYCVAYEVSPPDWQPPECQFEWRDSPLSAVSPTLAVADTAPSASDLETTPELIGEVEYLPNAWLAARPHPHPAAAQRWVVRCDKLVRIAPPAAQELLTWLKTLTAEGLQVEFKDVHRLIAAYFLAFGLNEWSKISIRKD
jgi:hypothetical protein